MLYNNKFDCSKTKGYKRLYFFNKYINFITMYHECEGGIEKSVPRITDLHHETCLVMTIGDLEGRIFLFHPHMNNGFFFLLTT